MAVDYSKFIDTLDPTKKANQDKDNPQSSIRWWLSKPEGDLAEAVWAQIAAIMQQDKVRIQQYGIHSRLYGNQANPLGNSGFTTTTINVNQSPARDRIAFNVIQSCTDTLTSKLAKNKVKPFHLTSKGDSKIQRRAKKLNDYSAGIFYENNAYQMMPVGFRDAAVLGDGIIHPYNFHSRVKWERVFPYEILVDYLEGHTGPQGVKTMHRVKNIDRDTLAKMMPDVDRVLIEQMMNTNQMLSSTTRSVADTVTIAESWRLPSEPGGDDGVHCLTIPGHTLSYEVYKKDFFPFARMPYCPRINGFWSQGLAEQLTPIQTELNRCLMTVQRSFHLGGSFKVLLHSSSKIVKSHLDNTIGAIIVWSGDHPPQYITPPMVQPEIYQQIQSLKQMAYEQSGLSQLSASGQKPAGLNSGEAQRVYHDIETDRFQSIGQAYEDFALQLDKLSISVARDIYEGKKDTEIKVPGKKFISTVKWSEVDMEDDEFVMQTFPESKLPTDPEGRLSSIQEMMQAGLISPETGRRLLDYPDLDEEENLANAQLDWIHEVLDRITEDGEYTAPEPFFSPMNMLKLGLEYYAVGKRDALEDTKLELLRNWIDECNTMIGASQPPQPAPESPQAAPAPPPVSNLLPNAPGAPVAA